MELRGDASMSPPRPARCPWAVLVLAIMVVGPRLPQLNAQTPPVRYGTNVPQDVKIIYERGLRYLAMTQRDDGNWQSPYSSGITGICLMAFLANGEDPNFGQYRLNVRKAVRAIISSQDATTGYIPNSMYCHGFGMLALAEAYGSVDDSQLWSDVAGLENRRSIGEALELAVRCAVTAQKNSRQGGWRYTPRDDSADTSVSGAVLVGLLAARNAGIEVPDQSINSALEYYRNSTSDSGIVAYTGGLGGMGQSMNRSAVATLVYAIGKRKHWQEYEATLGYITTRLEHSETGYPFYFRYYMSQALFQGDFEAWTKWKRENTRVLKETQLDDGRFEGGRPGRNTRPPWPFCHSPSIIVFFRSTKGKIPDAAPVVRTRYRRGCVRGSAATRWAGEADSGGRLPGSATDSASAFAARASPLSVGGVRSDVPASGIIMGRGTIPCRHTLLEEWR